MMQAPLACAHRDMTEFVVAVRLHLLLIIRKRVDYRRSSIFLHARQPLQLAAISPAIAVRIPLALTALRPRH